MWMQDETNETRDKQYTDWSGAVVVPKLGGLKLKVQTPNTRFACSKSNPLVNERGMGEKQLYYV